MEEPTKLAAMERPRKRPRYEQLDDSDWLRQQIGTRGVREIAEELGCGSSTVHRAVKRHGIDARSEQRAAKIRPLVGKRYGSLVVRGEAPPQPRSANIRVHVDCDCGGSKIITVYALEHRGPGWDHCGCQSKARWSSNGKAHRVHGHRRPVPTPTYRSWQAMRDRCYRSSTNGYRSFGGRGIKVCDRWRDNFAAFLADLGERPEGKTLDRIDVNGDYTPGNCRWATLSEQAANRRKAVWLSEDYWSLLEHLLTRSDLPNAPAVLQAIRRRGE